MRWNSGDGRIFAAARHDDIIPEAWAGNPLMDNKRRAFYEYNAALMEPWDGPAAVALPMDAKSGQRSTGTACARRAIM